MASTGMDTPEADDDLRPRGLLQQTAISAVLILLGIKIALDVLSRRWRTSGRP